MTKKSIIKIKNSINSKKFHKSCESNVFKNKNIKEVEIKDTFYENMKQSKENQTKDFPKNLNNKINQIKPERTNEKESDLFISQQINYYTNSRNRFTNRDSINADHTINLTKNSLKHYCPFCEHCNEIKDSNLDKYLIYTKEAKSIINKGFEYILNSNLLKNQKEIFSDYDLADFTKKDEDFSAKNKKFDMEVNYH